MLTVIEFQWIPKVTNGATVYHMQYNSTHKPAIQCAPRIELATALNEMMLNWRERTRVK